MEIKYKWGSLTEPRTGFFKRLIKYINEGQKKTKPHFSISELKKDIIVDVKCI